jgi:hypothetical protein
VRKGLLTMYNWEEERNQNSEEWEMKQAGKKLH